MGGMPHQASHAILKRLHRIGHILRRGKVISSKRLAEMEEVDRRTITRDIGFLREIGWKIDGTPQGLVFRSEPKELLRTH